MIISIPLRGLVGSIVFLADHRLVLPEFLALQFVNFCQAHFFAYSLEDHAEETSD